VQATIWGCRGSLAAPGRDTVRYGGNTSCVEVRAGDDTVIILDAGTGIRLLGMKLAREGVRRIHLLLTHLHLDHIEGLGFFAPIWDPEIEVEVWGPASPLRTLEMRLARYLSPPLFPVHLSDIPARLTFSDAPEGEWEIDGVRIHSSPVSHPGPTIAYRLSDGGPSLAYIPDHEPAIGVDLATLSPDWISGFELAANADVLLHDAQYTEEEYEERIGWGHSSVAHAVEFARRTHVGRLILFHHDPLHTDAVLDRQRERATELWNGSGPEPALACEGMQIEL
jgi:phosphoribosyl 1,2-cyclic phosphodiesterase